MNLNRSGGHTMERNQVKQHGDALEAILKQYAKENGLNVRIGSFGYDDTGFRFRSEFSQVSPEGVDLRAEREFKTVACLFGLKETDFGRVFLYGGAEYQIVGIRPSAQLRPISVKRLRDGKLFVFSKQAIARHLSLQTDEQHLLASKGGAK